MKQLNHLKARLVITSLMSLALITLFSACGDDAPAVQIPPTVTGYEPTSAFAGSTITINGTNFGTSVQDVKVTFHDGAVATVKAVNNTSIEVVVPNDAYVGPVDVAVKALDVEGGEFTVLTICTIWIGENPSPRPCPRIKAGEGPK